MKKYILATLIGLGAFGITACDTNEGPVEEAAEDIDEAVEEVEDEMDDATQ